MAEITGKIILIRDTQTVGANGFQKREFVVETPDDKYPQKIPLEFVKDKCSILDNFSEGQQVKVEYNLRGNEYKGRYFLSAQAWKIEGGAGGAPKAAGAKPAGKPITAAKAAPKATEDEPWA